MIENKRVLINGVVAEIGMDISPTDEITIDGKNIHSKSNFVYLVYNKPLGIETTTDTNKPNNIIDAIHYPERIFPVGRLDKDSSGLLILTSDGQIVNRILRSENAHEKEYLVVVDKPITDVFIEQMQEGVEIYNPVKHQMAKTLPSIVKKHSNTSFSIILTQGLNLQIRRMAKALGYHVQKLERVRIMNLRLENLPIGKVRHMTETEKSELFRLIENV